MEREPQVLIFEENRRRKQGRRRAYPFIWIHDGEEEGIVVLGVVGVKQEGRV